MELEHIYDPSQFCALRTHSFKANTSESEPNKFLVKIWAIELEKGLEENESIYKIFQYLILCEHAVFEESKSSDVMKMSAAHT